MKQSLWDLKQSCLILKPSSMHYHEAIPMGFETQRTMFLLCISIQSWSNPYGIWNLLLSLFCPYCLQSWSNPYGIWNFKCATCIICGWDIMKQSLWDLKRPALHCRVSCPVSWSNPYGIWNADGATTKSGTALHHEAIPMGFETPHWGWVAPKYLKIMKQSLWDLKHRFGCCWRCWFYYHEAIPMGFETISLLTIF